MPSTAKDKGKKLAFKPNEKSSITHHASPTQTVVSKGNQIC